MQPPAQRRSSAIRTWPAFGHYPVPGTRMPVRRRGRRTRHTQSVLQTESRQRTAAPLPERHDMAGHDKRQHSSRQRASAS
jgi:hypothetical protein